MPKPIVNKATTTWNGDLFTGSGTVNLDTSGAANLAVNWKARAEESGSATTPEELIGAAHATCFTMQFSNELKENGTPPTTLRTSAEVTFEVGKGITGIVLTVDGEVPGISAEDFSRVADSAKQHCPVSQALKAVDISITATLG
ncbi:peroxiredoxin [Tersicoccus solisilvae]|uniref:Peroxiredoxin n=1 Tax=Tersicoccus solisilvae TaxID=1882339 RepID=A0ABQ1NIK6_9MICC|nr:OsmC family peroxiredoxin [Tersicoccus solisilvae]GGC78201.1 peroxiredoxin [Tersicoccus solisilvae]